MIEDESESSLVFNSKVYEFIKNQGAPGLVKYAKEALGDLSQFEYLGGNKEYEKFFFPVSI